MELTAEIARELLHYEPETGKLYWKERGPEYFKDARSMNSWNAKYANKAALSYKDRNGYMVGAIFGRLFRAHRVIYLIAYGEFPSKETDHINGDRSDNRLANLREVSESENRRNRGKYSNNTSGVTGVYWKKGANKWSAYIRTKGKPHHLGYFSFFEEAVKARKQAEIEHGFHPNHGSEREIYER